MMYKNEYLILSHGMPEGRDTITSVNEALKAAGAKCRFTQDLDKGFDDKEKNPNLNRSFYKLEKLDSRSEGMKASFRDVGRILTTSNNAKIEYVEDSVDFHLAEVKITLQHENGYSVWQAFAWPNYGNFVCEQIYGLEENEDED